MPPKKIFSTISRGGECQAFFCNNTYNDIIIKTTYLLELKIDIKN